MNPVAQAMQDQWHKIAALLMVKFHQTHTVITEEEFNGLPDGHSIVIQEREDGIHLEIVDPVRAEQILREEARTYHPPPGQSISNTLSPSDASSVKGFNWQPLTDKRPLGKHSYYLVTFKKRNGELARPEVYPWSKINRYRKMNSRKNPMVTPISFSELKSSEKK